MRINFHGSGGVPVCHSGFDAFLRQNYVRIVKQNNPVTGGNQTAVLDYHHSD